MAGDSGYMAFLPWADLRGEIQVGKVTFWPYRLLAGKKVTDPPLRRHLRRIFRCYVDKEGRQVRSIAIASHTRADFRHLTHSEWAEVRAAVDALLFAIIYPNIRDVMRFDKVTRPRVAIDTH